MIEVSSDAQDVATGMRSVDDALRSGELIGAAVAPLVSQWPGTLASYAQGPQDMRAIVDAPTAVVESGGLVLQASASTTPLSGGLVPNEQGAAVEFGSPRRGLPARIPGGRVALPAAHQLRDQYVPLSVAGIETAYTDALGAD